MGCSSSQTALAWVPSTRCSFSSLSLPHHGQHHSLQGNLCSSTLNSSSPPSSPTLVSAELFLSYILTPLICCCAWQVFSLLKYVVTYFVKYFDKYVVTVALPMLLVGLALASNESVGAGWHRLYWMQWKLLAAKR